MRRIIFLLVFFYSICSLSQVKDDFSDGDFTENPAWVGEVEKFKVDKKGQLRLNDANKTGNAYLATPSTLINGATWSFYIHLLFNPSASNYAVFYLSSTVENFSGEGYMLMIGGKNDNISLLKYNGETAELLIEGIHGHLATTSPQANVKVHCDKEGHWSLYSKLIGGDEDYILEGTVTDKAMQVSAFIGLRCIYTASRNTGFVFDNIVIEANSTDMPPTPEVPDEPDIPEPNVPEPDIPNPDDTVPPKLLSVSALSDSVLSLVFDEAVNISLAGFEIGELGKVREVRLSANKKNISLLCAQKMEDKVSYTVYINKVKDLAGNYMEDSRINFTYYDPRLQTVSFGDIVFNEIMANPTGVASLPEVEYVELYNKTERPVNIKEWRFYYGYKSYKLPDAVIQAESYLVICSEKKSDLWTDGDIPVVGAKSFPELANSGKLLWLQDARDNVVAWVEYSNKWYGDDLKKKGGFALECRDVENLTNNSGNWSASNDVSGGTPGKANSIRGSFPDETLAEISYAYWSAKDTLIVCFTKPMNIVSLTTLDNYTVYSGNIAVSAVLPVVPDARQAKVVFSDSLCMGDILELELQFVKDISGFGLEGDKIIHIGVPEEADENEVLFNEILFNPRSGGSDYVELYNNSEKYVDLNRLYFSSRKEDGTLGERFLLSKLPRVLAPNAYLCFTKDIAAVKEQYECEEYCMFSIDKLPSLPDKAGNIVLLKPSGEVIDECVYTEKMHTAFLDDKEGISLEKINPVKASGIAANWLSASSASQGGTPGYVNSQYRELSVDKEESFRLERKVFSPDGDGMEDELVISYNFLKPDAIANVRVYDVGGRLIKVIAEHYRLEPEGVFIWNGQESDGSPARVGLYIIYIEAYAPSGKMERYKLGCAVGG